MRSLRRRELVMIEALFLQRLHVGVCARLRTHFLLLRQKKVSKEKATRSLGPCASLRATCAARIKRGLAQTRYAQTVASPDPLASALLSPARTGWSPELSKSEVKKSGNPAVRLSCPPRRYEEASSARPDGSGMQMFERSEFLHTPSGLSNAAYRQSRATNPARLSFAYFSLAKQRTSESPAGARPGLQRQQREEK